MADECDGKGKVRPGQPSWRARSLQTNGTAVLDGAYGQCGRVERHVANWHRNSIASELAPGGEVDPEQ